MPEQEEIHTVVLEQQSRGARSEAEAKFACERQAFWAMHVQLMSRHLYTRWCFHMLTCRFHDAWSGRWRQSAEAQRSAYAGPMMGRLSLGGPPSQNLFSAQRCRQERVGDRSR